MSVCPFVVVYLCAVFTFSLFKVIRQEINNNNKARAVYYQQQTYLNCTPTTFSSAMWLLLSGLLVGGWLAGWLALCVCQPLRRKEEGVLIAFVAHSCSHCIVFFLSTLWLYTTLFCWCARYCCCFYVLTFNSVLLSAPLLSIPLVFLWIFERVCVFRSLCVFNSLPLKILYAFCHQPPLHLDFNSAVMIVYLMVHFSWLYI